jgi:hypothetical protein
MTMLLNNLGSKLKLDHSLTRWPLPQNNETLVGLALHDRAVHKFLLCVQVGLSHPYECCEDAQLARAFF